MSETADDRETWGLLRVMFKDDGTARRNLITHLGFIVPEETKEIVQDDLSAEVNAPGIEDSTTDKAGLGAEKETTIFPSDNGEDFFNNLPSPKADTPHSTSGDKFVAGGTVPITDHVQEEHDELEESANSSNALAVGDYKGAVAKCISANKMAAALVIAHAGGPTLWESTRDQYLKLSHSPYRKIVSAMVSNYLSSLVNTRPLKFWKETLAVLCSFSSVEAWEDLCNTLAARHIAAGNTLAATICYICAGNIDKTVDIWSRNLTTDHEGRSYVNLLQVICRRVMGERIRRIEVMLESLPREVFLMDLGKQNS
uniref:protein transport protein SEC31 homolog B-like n=1 Tax=Fragaria vesca subsp. vesca TaxID=101020 RepID=UPI0005C8752C|nr:PREDICTED: protein transport protein SEC31 homolog B-like [Fragaria vesca subsp. vesca]